MALTLTSNFDDADGFYARLLATHEDLSLSESAALNARLILILANHIGDTTALNHALQIAQNPGGQ